MAAAVSPEALLKELSQLWVSLGKEDDAGVLRACAMTLIMASEDNEDATAAGEILAELIHDHPSRAVMLRVRQGSAPLLESRVLAQCWMPFGKRQQICCEQIDISASEASLLEVQRLLMGLVAPDLPVVLVCRGWHLFLLEAFQPVLAVASRVVIDSTGASEPAWVLSKISSLRAGGIEVQDLAWTRLTRLRQALASLFDRPEALDRLPAVTSIEVTYTQGPVPSETLYLAAWLQGGVKAGVTLAPVAPGEPVPAIRMTGPGVEIRAHASSPAMIEVSSDGILFPVHVTPVRDSELLREELSITSHDSIYDEVLARARSLA